MTRKRMLKFLLWLLSGILFVVISISVILWVYKDEIIELAIDEANKYLKVKVEVSDVDLTFWGTFPNLSIDFNNVFVRDSYEGATERDTLLFTERIRCRFDPMDVWRENYEVESVEFGKGTLQLKVDTAGLTNYDIIRTGDEVEESEEVDFKLKRLFVENLRFQYTNSATSQEYSTTLKQIAATGDFTKRRFTAKTVGNFQIHAAKSGAINLVKEQPAEISLGVEIDLDSARVRIPASTIYISELPFNFEGEVDSSRYHFHLNGKGFDLSDVANKLAPESTRELRTYSGTGKVSFDLNVSGVNASLEGPEIQCDFGVANGNLKEPSSGISLKAIDLEGSFIRKGKAGSEELELNNLRFSSAFGPFKGNLRIRNFLRPLYTAQASGAIDLKILHQFFGSHLLEKLSGKASLNTDLQVQQEVDPNGRSTFNLLHASGSVDLNNVSLQLLDDKREFYGGSGTLLFRNNELGVKQLKVKFLESDLRLDGYFSNLNGFLNGDSPLSAEATVRSNALHVADLSSSEKVDKMIGQRSFILPSTVNGNIDMHIVDLEYEGHRFKNCEGLVHVEPRRVAIDRFHFTNASSRISGKVSVFEKRPEILELNCNLVSNRIEMSEVFREWNNFDQDVITNENLSGEAALNMELFVPFDFRNGAITNQILMTAALRISNGRLRNVGAFQEIINSLQTSNVAKLAIGNENIKGFSSKLKDLRFESLENTIVIRNSIISIPTMSVKSSALDLEVAGKHHFNNDIDYRFGFRFRDLKQKKESEFGTIVDDGTGKMVFLRMYGNMSDPKIEWDKESNKESRKERNEQEAQDVKSMLKSEFGLFKNDPTVESYVQEKRPKEEITVDFEVLEGNDSIVKQKTKKDTKLNKLLNNWKQESEEGKKEEFEIDD